jgi:nitrogen regulatory protein P-II 2
MELHPLKLVTIVAEEPLKEQLKAVVLELGATGCSYHSTEGTGSHTSHDDAFSESFQMKVVCPAAVATKILTYVADHYFDEWAIVAWAIDVEVVRGDHFIKH